MRQPVTENNTELSLTPLDESERLRIKTLVHKSPHLSLVSRQVGKNELLQNKYINQTDVMRN